MQERPAGSTPDTSTSECLEGETADALVQEAGAPRDLPVRLWFEVPNLFLALWWNSRHTALRTQRLRTCGCNSCQGYQFSVWVEAEVVQAERCECSVSGCESRRSNRLSRRRREARQTVATCLMHVPVVSACPDSGYSVVVASDAWNVVASVRFRVP